MRLAVLDAGLSYQRRTIAEFTRAGLLGSRIPLRDLHTVDLPLHPALLIPCRTPGHRLAEHRDRLDRYVRGGGMLIVMGETNPQLFLEGVAFAPEPTNFWWWRETGSVLGVSITMPMHPLMLEMSEADCSWHVHGTLQGPEGSEAVISWTPNLTVSSRVEPGALLIDYPLGEGRVIATTLDPIYHHGSGFMPATTRFLKCFLPNAVAYAATHRNAMELGRKTSGGRSNFARTE